MKGVRCIGILLILLLCTVTSFTSNTSLQSYVCRITASNCRYIKVYLLERHNRTHYFELQTYQNSSEVNLQIVGTSTSAVVKGLTHYLRVYCNTTYTQFGLSQNEFKMVYFHDIVHYDLNDLTYYYGNICAYSYSYWDWDWKRWESHIDWILFKGFNMVLVPTGIESVQLQTFTALGVSEEEVYQFFNGPAYLAWSRMGNMENFTAPLTPDFIESQVILQKRISNRLTKLGVNVIIPGFSGFVPHAFTKLYNISYFNNVNCWNGFNDSYSCLTQVDPTKKLYISFGGIYMKNLLQTFQTSHMYAVDMFNENTPKNSSLQYLESCGENTVSVIKSADPYGIWLLQGWMFGYDSFWDNSRIASYLNSVNSSEIIILDMFAEVNPTWNRTSSFHGKPFIWTIINNFGGNTLINGNIKSTMEGFIIAANNSKSLVGFGFMPEGIHENSILLDAMMQFTALYNVQKSSFSPYNFYAEWKNKISNYRYSNYNGHIVQNVVEKLYTLTEGSFPTSCIIYRRPGFDLPFNPNSELADNHQLLLEYHEIIRLEQVKEYTQVFLYDFSSVMQNYGELLFHKKYQELVRAFKNKDVDLFHNYSQMMIKTIELLDEIFSLLPERSLHCYESSVQQFASMTKDSPVKLAYNLRLQLTTWGFNGEVLDYAFKMWSGLLNGYYKRRWETFFAHMLVSLREKKPFDQDTYDLKVAQVEKNFAVEGAAGSCFPWKEQNIFKLRRILIELILLDNSKLY